MGYEMQVQQVKARKAAQQDVGIGGMARRMWGKRGDPDGKRVGKNSAIAVVREGFDGGEAERKAQEERRIEAEIKRRQNLGKPPGPSFSKTGIINKEPTEEELQAAQEAEERMQLEMHRIGTMREKKLREREERARARKRMRADL